MTLSVVFINLWAAACLANSSPADVGAFHVGGFGTVGISQIDEPAGWAYERNLGQVTNTSRFRADLDSRLGLQVNYRPSGRFEFVAQAVASRLDHGANVGDAVELGFATCRPDPNWTVRGGRVNLDLYLLSDHRDVGFTYEYVRPPVEFYSQTPTFLDGADLSRVWTLDDAQWKAKLFGGRTSVGLGDYRLVLEPLFGVMLERESEHLVIRASAAHSQFANTLNTVQPLIAGLDQLDALPVPPVVVQAKELASGLSSAGTSLDYLAAGILYDRSDWLLSGEISRLHAVRAPDASFTSGYVSAGRRFGPVSVFGVESATARSATTLATPNWVAALSPYGPALAQHAQALAALAAGAINGVEGHQHTGSVGARWDLNTQVALKAQWDHIQTDPNGSALWAAAGTAGSTANVFSLVLDFVF